MNEKNKIVSLYSLTKLYLALVGSLATIIMPGIPSKIICFVAANILAAVSGVWPVFFKRVMKSIGVLFLILVIIQTLFYPGKTILASFWIFSLKLEGLLFALKLGFVLLAVGGFLAWFFIVTTERDLVLALEKRWTPHPTCTTADWARSAVAFMSSKAVISGVGENRFAPQNMLSIQEAVVLAQKLLETMN